MGSKIKWGVAKRLEFIEFRLFWHGRFNRTDIVNTFQISPQQASNDIAKYKENWPNNLEYDEGKRVYLRQPSFQPHLIAQNTDRHLLQLVAIESGWMQKEETWYDSPPPMEVITLKKKTTNPLILMAVLDAIRECRLLRIYYSSMSGPAYTWRTIAPHAMVENSGNWYVRAWSEDHNDFRDYKLSRIQKTECKEKATIDFSLDYQWVHQINLKIVPNPKLPDDQKLAIAEEFEMQDGILTIPVRLSSAFYLMNQYNLDVEPDVLDEKKQQLVLINGQDISNARKMARQMSKEALERALPQNTSE
ncbi:MAG: WYL domain-containing protein [Schleiferiaceae bacterium]|nr:WYL domain-containing protein [Schleiferiaceae bacterium]